MEGVLEPVVRHFPALGETWPKIGRAVLELDERIVDRARGGIERGAGGVELRIEALGAAFRAVHQGLGRGAGRERARRAPARGCRRRAVSSSVCSPCCGPIDRASYQLEGHRSWPAEPTTQASARPCQLPSARGEIARSFAGAPGPNTPIPALRRPMAWPLGRTARPMARGARSGRSGKCAAPRPRGGLSSTASI